MRLRGKIDANHREIVKALRDAGASVTSLANVGDGCVDLLVGANGVTVLMEVKSGLKDCLTADEIEWHSRWRGGALCVVRSVSEALGVLGLNGRKE
jgi:Holliday junction resolvase